MTQVLDHLTSKPARDLIAKIEPTFNSLPNLPKGITSFLVTIVPWLALIGGIGSIISGANTLLRPGSVGTFARIISAFSDIPPAYFYIVAVIQIAQGLLLLLAFNLLRSKKINGWIYLFWNQIASLVQSLIGLAFGLGGVFGIVIGALIGFYFLFEIKPSYK